jgi:uncharacterized membrane protein YdjX (TVP38/TMEM64 family)
VCDNDNDDDDDDNDDYNRGRMSVSAVNWRGLFLVAFGLAVLVVSAYVVMPDAGSAERRAHIRLPRDLDQLRALYGVLSGLQAEHPVAVVYVYLVLYVVLQTCSIPGSIFLSFLGGALFGLVRGVLLVAAAAAFGASGAYLVSACALRGVVERTAGARLGQFRELVAQRSGRDLLLLIVGLRITPLLPNWFVNLASPVARVPLSTFFLGTFFGVMAPSLFHVRAGVALDQLVKPSDALDWGAVLSLFGLGLVTVLPTVPAVNNFFFGAPPRPAQKQD